MTAARAPEGTGEAATAGVLARVLALHPRRIDLSLGRVERLLEALGRPQDRLPPVVHVAGTNGKGSTTAFLRAMLEADGRRVHAYTSPHLVRFEERVRLAAPPGEPGGGRLVAPGVLADALARAETANDGAPITVFEIITAAALLLFAEAPADALLLEVGLGGRYDATNVVPRPLVSVVTSVGLDHAEFLGTDVAGIAREKAGVLKRGRPGVLAPGQRPEVVAAVEAEARRVGAPLLVGDQDFTVHEEHGRLAYQDEHGLLDLPLPRLAGRHQHLNAAAAIAALRAGFGPGFPAAAVEAGMRGVVWPGRLQRLTGLLAALAPPGAELWLDGGHNPDGGRALAAAMAEREERDPRPLVLLVGMLATKDVAGFLAPFAGLAAEVLALPIPGEAAARPPAEVAASARAAGLPAAEAGDLPATLAFLRARRWPSPPRLLIAGSLHLAGAALALDGAAVD